jgi:hypothetical protein
VGHPHTVLGKVQESFVGHANTVQRNLKSIHPRSQYRPSMARTRRQSCRIKCRVTRSRRLSCRHRWSDRPVQWCGRDEVFLGGRADDARRVFNRRGEGPASR